MSTEETTNTINEFAGHGSSQPAEHASEADVEATPKPGWNRRNFLKAAALGAAAAAFAGKGSLGPASVMAHTDDKSACTANDIEVLGGHIINEPCTCSPGGKFEAIAQFTVINQNNARRKCVTLHLGAGGTLGGKDFLLTTDPSGDPTKGDNSIGGLGTTQTMYAKLGTLDCNFGKECYPGSVIAFQTAKNQSDTACDGPLMKYPGGQCRRQEICIIGFGAKLACTANCSPDCGGTATLSASVETAPVAAGETPFLYVLSVAGQSDQEYGPTADTSHDFSVTVTDSTSVTLKVYDSRLGPNCFRSAGPVALSANPITVTAASGTPPACAGGNSTLTASATASGSVTYEFFEGANSLGSVTTSTGTGLISVLLGPGEHTIKVVATNGNCSDDETFTVTVPQPVKADLSLSGNSNCDGKLTFKATVSGGTGPYTITFSVNDVAKQTGSSDSFAYGPVLDGACNKISCSATDSASCPSTPSTPGGDSKSIKQCVTTSAC